MLLELFQVFSISVPFQEMKAPDLVQLEAQSQRDSAVKSASFSSAVHKNSHQVFIHSRVPLLSNTDNKSLCKDLNIFRKIGCYRSQQLTQHPTCMNPPPCIPPPPSRNINSLGGFLEETTGIQTVWLSNQHWLVRLHLAAWHNTRKQGTATGEKENRARTWRVSSEAMTQLFGSARRRPSIMIPQTSWPTYKQVTTVSNTPAAAASKAECCQHRPVHGRVCVYATCC